MYNDIYNFSTIDFFAHKLNRLVQLPKYVPFSNFERFWFIIILRTLHVVCRKKFAKYSWKICEKFAKYSWNIREIFAKYSRKIRKKLKFAKYLRKIREKIRKNSQMLIFREIFANFSRIFREYFANFSQIFCEYFANISRIFCDRPREESVSSTKIPI